jgi:hypothetical protein
MRTAKGVLSESPSRGGDGDRGSLSPSGTPRDWLLVPRGALAACLAAAGLLLFALAPTSVSAAAYVGSDDAEDASVFGSSAERRACRGTIEGATGRYRFRVTAIPAIDCATAKRKAQRYDRLLGQQPRGWLCAIARQEFAPRLFSCSVRVGGRLRKDAVFALEVKRRPPSGRRCRPFTVGIDSFFHIRTAGVSCRAAKRLLDQATLRVNRRDRRVWPYGGYQWRLTRRTETSSLITGRRGARLIRAGFAKQ